MVKIIFSQTNTEFVEKSQNTYFRLHNIAYLFFCILINLSRRRIVRCRRRLRNPRLLALTRSVQCSSYRKWTTFSVVDEDNEKKRKKVAEIFQNYRQRCKVQFFCAVMTTINLLNLCFFLTAKDYFLFLFSSKSFTFKPPSRSSWMNLWDCLAHVAFDLETGVKFIAFCMRFSLCATDARGVIG